MALCVQKLQPAGAGASRFTPRFTAGCAEIQILESLTFHHNNMVRADPITTCEVAITNMKNPKIRRFVKALVGFPPGVAHSATSLRNHAASAAAAAPSAGGFPNGSPTTYVHNQHKALPKH
jgi:hypothetical protein